MALSSNTRIAEIIPGNGTIELTYTVKAASTIYQGAVVGYNAGAIPAAATNQNLGIAQNYAAAGETVRVRTGQIIEVTVAGTANVGVPVYTTADDTFTAVSTSASLIGYIVGIGRNDATKRLVLIDPWRKI